MWLSQPILSLKDLEVLLLVNYRGWTTKRIEITYPISDNKTVFVQAIDDVCQQAEQAVKSGYRIIVLSDRDIGSKKISLPSLIAVGAVHHHLIHKKLRLKCAIVIDTGEAR